MDITARIAANLDDWMATSLNLNTIKKVASRAGVGFGTVQRARNGDGNTTIKNLTAIALAFGRSIEDLLRPQAYPQAGIIIPLAAKDAAIMTPLVLELVAVAESISERGQAELIGRAKELARTHPRVQPNHASC